MDKLRNIGLKLANIGTCIGIAQSVQALCYRLQFSCCVASKQVVGSTKLPNLWVV